MIERILLIRWGGLGDLLVALPAVRLIGRLYRSASLTLIGRKAYASLLLETGVVDRVIGEESSNASSLFRESGGARCREAEWLEEFDLVVGWLNREKSGFPEAGRCFGAGDKRWKIIRYDPGSGEPISRVFFGRTLEALEAKPLPSGCYDDCARLPLDGIPPEAVALGRGVYSPGQKFVVIHPGSGGETKRWPLDNFLEIARRLRGRGVTGTLVIGEAERAIERRVDQAARSLGWVCLRSPALLPLALAMARADLYIGNDSGITHLAAACGAEAVALFRDDLLDAWRPAGKVHALSAPSLDRISLESVWATAAQLLCIPSHLAGFQRVR
jgi:heptosyltransferase-3